MSNPENLDNPAAPDADGGSAGTTVGDDSKLIDPEGALAHAQAAERDAAQAKADEAKEGDKE